MAKQYMLPLLRRLTNLQTEVATGRTRRNYGVGRKTEIARLERWTGRAKKTSVRRTPARHCACSALLAFLHGLETPPAPSPRIKNFGVWGVMPSTIKQRNTMQNHVMPCKNRVKSISPRPYCRYGRGECANQKKSGPVKNGKLGKTTTADHGGRGRRRPGLHGSHRPAAECQRAAWSAAT